MSEIAYITKPPTVQSHLPVVCELLRNRLLGKKTHMARREEGKSRPSQEDTCRRAKPSQGTSLPIASSSAAVAAVAVVGGKLAKSCCK